MSLNPRAIATLGVGFGAISIAYLGLWPTGITPPEPPVVGPTSGRIVYTSLNRLAGYADDRDLLEMLPAIVEVINGRR